VDVAVITAAALASMGMTPADPDAAAVETAAEAAVALVVDYLGNPELVAPEPQPVLTATTQVTVELYRRKDAVFGVLNTWADPDFGPVRVSTDWLKGVEALLHPYMRDSFGVG
jgi:hypothetical protein